MKRRIIIAGGSGFLGRVLAAHFVQARCDVVILTRQPREQKEAVREVAWDGRRIGEWKRELEGAAAVVNLSGRSVDCRYNRENRREILDSRIFPTHVIGEAIQFCAKPPPVWLNASTATIYKHTYGPAWDDSGEIGGTPEVKDVFSVEVATAWEEELFKAVTPQTRKVALRTAMVLGSGKNSVFPVLRRLVRLGLGGRMGDGRQLVSWIHEQDFCRAIDWVIANENLAGPINVCAPNPLSNAEMMRDFREVCGVLFGLPASKWMLEIGAFFLRTETELILKSRRVYPRRLLDSDFAFHFPTFNAAIAALNTPPAANVSAPK